jgi:hypothetical protein
MILPLARFLQYFAVLNVAALARTAPTFQDGKLFVFKVSDGKHYT